jgi:protein-S-isoprenylcysteine O-methyltransferase Ste14
MYIWFLVCALGAIATMPLYFLSVEHLKLQERYGKEKGIKIGEISGVISGWGFFLFWFGIWISPQPRFTIPILSNLSVLIPVINFSIPLLHLVIFTPFFTMGAWLGIKGVEKTTLQVAETHRPQKIVMTGVYSIVRHPQYFGGLLAHVGISILLSAWYSLLSTPLMVALIYFISWKEEEELIKEFGKEYEGYKEKVPMLIPRLRK